MKNRETFKTSLQEDIFVTVSFAFSEGKREGFSATKS